MLHINFLITRISIHYVDGSGGEAKEIGEAIDEGIINQESPTEEAQVPVEKEQESPLSAPLNPEGIHTCRSERSKHCLSYSTRLRIFASEFPCCCLVSSEI